LPTFPALDGVPAVDFSQLPKPGMPARPMMQFPVPHRGSIPAFNRPLIAGDMRTRMSSLHNRNAATLPKRPMPPPSMPGAGEMKLDASSVVFPAPPKPPTFTDPFSSDKRKQRFPGTLPPPLMPGRVPQGPLPPLFPPRQPLNNAMYDDLPQNAGAPTNVKE
jgi:hypothetical protein